MTVHGIAKINDLANSISFEVLEMSPFGLICVMKYSRSISTSNILSSPSVIWYDYEICYAVTFVFGHSEEFGYVISLSLFLIEI
jgi:hypothetical protein